MKSHKATGPAGSLWSLLPSITSRKPQRGLSSPHRGLSAPEASPGVSGLVPKTAPYVHLPLDSVSDHVSGQVRVLSPELHFMMSFLERREAPAACTATAKSWAWPPWNSTVQPGPPVSLRLTGSPWPSSPGNPFSFTAHFHHRFTAYTCQAWLWVPCPLPPPRAQCSPSSPPQLKPHSFPVALSDKPTSIKLSLLRTLRMQPGICLRLVINISTLRTIHKAPQGQRPRCTQHPLLPQCRGPLSATPRGPQR